MQKHIIIHKIPKLSPHIYQRRYMLYQSLFMLQTNHYINKMSCNDKDEQQSQLLNWVNHERTIIGQHSKLLSLTQLKQSRLLPSLLKTISPNHFSQIYDKHFDYKGYLLEIEKYLIEMQDLRIKRSHRQYLLENENMQDMVKLVLFLIMKQDIKHDYITRILELQEDTQIYLMNQLKKMQNCIENNIQIKQIHHKIEQLQSQNQYLNQKLKNLQQHTNAARNIENTLRQQNQYLKNQQRDYNNEKTSVLQAIGVDQLMKDYLSIYKELQFEQRQAIATYKQIQSDTLQLQQNNRQINDKVQEDQLIIQHLNDELITFKNLYEQAKTDADQQKNLNKENLQLKSSTTTTDRNRQSKIQFDQGQTNTSRSVNILDDIDEPLQNIIKNYSEGIMGKLENLYAKISYLQRDISSLKDQNCQLVSSNRKKQIKIVMAQIQFNSFVIDYQLTIRG